MPLASLIKTGLQSGLEIVISKTRRIALAVILAIGTGTVPASIIDVSGVNLIDETGQPVTIDSFDGYLRLVFFGYTHCPDICPLTLFYTASALKTLGKDAADNVRVLFVSVDPKRDTPEVLARYTGSFHESIIGLTGTYEQIRTAAASFRTSFGYNLREKGKEKSLDKEEYLSLPADAPYVPYHSSQIYVLGPEGDLLDIIGYGSKTDAIAEKIQAYLDNAAG